MGKSAKAGREGQVKASKGPKGLSGFICKRCGQCCTSMPDGYQFSVGRDQVRIWALVVPKLLVWLNRLPSLDAWDGWISPATGEFVERCPWLREYKHSRWKRKGFHCLIQAYKPPTCRKYPHDRGFALATGCLGFSHLDLSDGPGPKQDKL